MKYLAAIAGILLGGIFLLASGTYFFGTMPKMDFPEGSPIAHFMAAFGPTGYMSFVKVFELTGGILVMIPSVRNLGLLLLGPVIVNIIAFHFLITGPASLLDVKHMWMLYVAIVCALCLLWAERRKWAALIK